MKFVTFILLLITIKANGQSAITVSVLSSFKYYDVVELETPSVSFNTSFQPITINYINARLIYEFSLSTEFYDLHFNRLENEMKKFGLEYNRVSYFGVERSNRIVPSIAIKYSFIQNEKTCFYGGVGFAMSKNYYNDVIIRARKRVLINDVNVNELYFSPLSKNRFTKSFNLITGLLLNLEKTGTYLLSIESGINYLQLGELSLNMEKMTDSNDNSRPDIPVSLSLPSQIMVGGALSFKYRFNMSS